MLSLVTYIVSIKNINKREYQQKIIRIYQFSIIIENISVGLVKNINMG